MNDKETSEFLEEYKRRGMMRGAFDNPAAFLAWIEARDPRDQMRETFMEDYRWWRDNAETLKECEAEQAAERSAAFGPGETVINEITGQTYRT